MPLSLKEQEERLTFRRESAVATAGSSTPWDLNLVLFLVEIKQTALRGVLLHF